MSGQLAEALVVAAPAAKVPAARDQPSEAFTIIIQIDAWNIRERDSWGQIKRLRRKNPIFDRWHWVYTAACFQLSHRCKKGSFKSKLRAMITELTYAATRRVNTPGTAIPFFIRVIREIRGSNCCFSV